MALGQALAAPSLECALFSGERRDRLPVAACTGCHGDLGKNFRRDYVMPGGEFGHPVDVDYASAADASSDALRPPDQLPPWVPLVEGRISCTTCHDGMAGTRHSLARASQKELCLTCHVF